MNLLAEQSGKLLYFYEIAKAGNLQTSSRKLNLSAPTLSYSLQQLETLLQTKLFVRTSKGLILTNAGEKLYSFCQRYFKEMETVHEALRDLKTHEKRRIIVGSFQSIAIHFWPLLRSSMENVKGLTFSIKTGRSSIIHEALLKREIDIGITVGSTEHPKIIRHELFKDYFAFYIKKGIKVSKSANDHDLIYIPDAQDENNKNLKTYVESWELKFKDVIEVDSFEVLVEFIKLGLGVGILPVRLGKKLKEDLQQIKFYPQDESYFGLHRFYLSHRDDLDIPQKIITEFLKAGLKAVRQI